MITAFVTCLIMSGAHVCLEGTPHKSQADCRETAIAQEKLRRKDSEMTQVEGYYCREIQLFARPDVAYWSEDDSQFEPRHVILGCALLKDNSIECIPVKHDGEYVTEKARCYENLDWFYESASFDSAARKEVLAWLCKEGKTFSESNENAYLKDSTQ